MDRIGGPAETAATARAAPDAAAPVLEAQWHQLAALLANSPDVFALVRVDGQLVCSNRALHCAEAREATATNLLDWAARGSRAALERALLEAARSGNAERLDVAGTGAAGEVIHQCTIAPVIADGVNAMLSVNGVDVTERKRTEERLRRREALLVDTQGVAHLGTWEWDVSEPNATWSQELYRIYGLTPETYSPSYEGYLDKVHPDDRAHVMAATERVFREHEPYSHDERIFRSDGAIRHLHTWAQAQLNDSGKLVRLLGVCLDITDRKNAEIALEEHAVALAEHADELTRANQLLRTEMETRDRIEKQLRQAQKLEAVGRLAGGIAHDFNNLMGVVVGYSSMIYNRLAADDPTRRYLAEIMSAGERAARLTRQLLEFSRTQAIVHELLDLNSMVDDLGQMLQRLIGDDVELGLDLESDIGAIEASPSQLEQLIVNLTVNARDAMPEGGVLRISTRAVELEANDPVCSDDLAPGRYVLLSVNDSGVGMDEATASKIFDPFFTTKPEGKGTGLGLSTVYGVVQQSGGAIRVKSSPGAGSSFSIYFPRLAALPASNAGTRRSTETRGSETILLVEDQIALRTAVREGLESLGYSVRETNDPVEALRVAAEDPGTIDLLLTDVIMPKMNGRDLADRVVGMRPNLKVLFISGYSHDVLEARVDAFLQKPFTIGQLAQRLRALLDAPT